MHSGLEKAYSSTLHLAERDHGRVVIKTVDAKERKNEIFFHEQLKAARLPSMNVHEEGNTLVLDFIEHAETLGDKETAETYHAFGAAMKKMHAISFAHPFYIDETGASIETSWQQLIDQSINEGIERQRTRANGLEQRVVDQIITILRASRIGEIEIPVLLHCDAHANNVLLKDDQVILFDKGDHIMAGDALYDLALIFMDLPGAAYTLGPTIERDTLLLEAFINGYGTDFTTNKKIHDYVLLRALERWPNPFEKEIPEIIKVILNKQV